MKFCLLPCESVTPVAEQPPRLQKHNFTISRLLHCLILNTQQAFQLICVILVEIYEYRSVPTWFYTKSGFQSYIQVYWKQTDLTINLDCQCKNCWGWRCGSQLEGFTSINISNPLKFSTLFSFFHFLSRV